MTLEVVGSIHEIKRQLEAYCLIKLCNSSVTLSFPPTDKSENLINFLRGLMF